MARDSRLTETLNAAKSGDERAAEELLPLLYEELRSLGKALMRNQPPGHTLQATALVHEAFAKVVGTTDPGWDGRGHFFGAAARAMREILVDQARRRNAIKRGGDKRRVDIDDFAVGTDDSFVDVVALDDVLHKFEKSHPREYNVVLLKFFAGLNMQEIAEHLRVSKTRVEKDWRLAKAWLYKEMDEQSDQGNAASTEA